MANKPFVTEISNIYNQVTYTTAPATFGTNSVVVSQGQQRRIIDTTTTSISENPQMNFFGQAPMNNFYNPTQNRPNHGGVSFVPENPQTQYFGQPQTNNFYNPELCPTQRYPIPGEVPFITENSQMQYFGQPTMNNFYNPDTYPAQGRPIPEGVSFTFNPQAQNYALSGFSNNEQQPVMYQQFQQPINQMYQHSLTLEQQIALNRLQQDGLNAMLLQEQMKRNPYQVQFHHDGQTSTSDLLCCNTQIPPSRGLPDFTNISGAAGQNVMNERELDANKNACSCSSSYKKKVSFAPFDIEIDGGYYGKNGNGSQGCGHCKSKIESFEFDCYKEYNDINESNKSSSKNSENIKSFVDQDVQTDTNARILSINKPKTGLILSMENVDINISEENQEASKDPNEKTEREEKLEKNDSRESLTESSTNSDRTTDKSDDDDDDKTRDDCDEEGRERNS